MEAIARALDSDLAYRFRVADTPDESELTDPELVEAVLLAELADSRLECVLIEKVFAHVRTVTSGNEDWKTRPAPTGACRRSRTLLLFDRRRNARNDCFE